MEAPLALATLLGGYPVKSVDVAGAGRSLVAGRDLRRGEVVLVSRAAGVSLRGPRRAHWCAHCLGCCGSEKLRLACGGCGARFCSAACARAAGVRGGSHWRGACEARQAAAAAAPPGAGDTLAALLVDLLARRMRELEPDEVEDSDASDSSSSEGESEGAGATGADGCDSQGFDALALAAPLPSSRHVADLVVPPTADAAAFFQTERFELATHVAATTVCALRDAGGGAAALLSGGVDAPSAAVLLRGELCNAFGLWEPRLPSEFEADTAGKGVFPAAALLNHSCEPNTYHDVVRAPFGGALVVRALVDVGAGEPLTHAYGALRSARASARRRALRPWCFSCSCARCERDDPRADAPMLAARVCVCGNACPQQASAATDKDGGGNGVCACDLTNALPME